MPNDTALVYAVVTVFGAALGGVLAIVLLRPRVAPALRARRLRAFDIKVRRALASETPDALAGVYSAAFEETGDFVLHARHWTTLGYFSRRLRDAASQVERDLPEGRACAEAFACAVYGSFERARDLIASRPTAPGHQTVHRLELEFLVKLLRDGDPRGALVCAHQGVAAAKSPSYRGFAAIWDEWLTAAEVAGGQYTFDEIDALIERVHTATSELLLTWAASAYAKVYCDESRAMLYSRMYRKIAPHCVAPSIDSVHATGLRS